MTIGWIDLTLAAVAPAILVAAVSRRMLGWAMLAWVI